MGWLISGNRCSFIAGCIDFVLDYQGNQICIECDSTSFHSIPVNNTCQCLDNKTLFGDTCVLSIPGCISYNITGDYLCLFCSIVAYYSGLPDPEGNCTCKAGYQVVNGVCAEICGDGVVINSSSLACDDGNG